MKSVLKLAAGVAALVLVGAATLYERPLWVQTQAIHFGLFVSGVHSDYVLTPEGRIHYYEATAGVPGGGVPVVLVHGLADRSESWAAMMNRLKQAGFHVYALDLLGAGRSPKPADSDYSIATQEQVVVDFIHALGLQKVDIGGWSMGGWVTLRLALDHPEMVDRVVVYDSAGIRHQVSGGPGVFHITDGAGLQRLYSLLEPKAAPLPGFVVRDVLRSGGQTQWVTDKSMESMQTGRDLLDDRLGGLKAPLLLVWGSDDALLPVEIGRQMHGMVAGSELDVVEGCGHLAPKTCDGRVAVATVEFLKAGSVNGGEKTR